MRALGFEPKKEEVRLGICEMGCWGAEESKRQPSVALPPHPQTTATVV